MGKVKTALWDGSDDSDNNSPFNPDNVGYPGEDEYETCRTCGDGYYVNHIFEDNGRALEADICNECGAAWTPPSKPEADF